MKNNDEEYLPYSKSDFRKYWYNSCECRLEFFKIIRPLTMQEMLDCGDAGEEYEEMMYLVQNDDGEEYEAYDLELLEDCAIDESFLKNGLLTLFESLIEIEGDDFIETLPIEKWIKLRER